MATERKNSNAQHRDKMSVDHTVKNVWIKNTDLNRLEGLAKKQEWLATTATIAENSCPINCANFLRCFLFYSLICAYRNESLCLCEISLYLNDLMINPLIRLITCFQLLLGNAVLTALPSTILGRCFSCGEENRCFSAAVFLCGDNRERGYLSSSGGGALGEQVALP